MPDASSATHHNRCHSLCRGSLFCMDMQIWLLSVAPNSLLPCGHNSLPCNTFPTSPPQHSTHNPMAWWNRARCSSPDRAAHLPWCVLSFRSSHHEQSNSYRHPFLAHKFPRHTLHQSPDIPLPLLRPLLFSFLLLPATLPFSPSYAVLTRSCVVFLIASFSN